MDNLVKLWSVPEWVHIRTFAGHEKSVNGFALSPDGKILVSASSDSTVKIWSFPDGAILHNLQDRKKVVSSVQISADGELVNAASYGGRVSIWSKDGEPVAAFKASKKNLSSTALSPDRSVLATSGLGDEIKLWSMPECKYLNSLTGHNTAVGGLKFIDDGKIMISVGYEGSIRFWDTATWETVRVLDDSLGQIRATAFSHDERRMAVGIESLVQVYDYESLQLKHELPVSTKVINGVAFSPDSRWLAIGGADKKIRIWEFDR